jgi:Fe-S-cluster containining protein
MSDIPTCIVLLVGFHSKRIREKVFGYFLLIMEAISSNTIEVFSIELWREIFDHFNGIELWHSFHNLNETINLIIDQTSLHFNFKKLGNYTYFLENILPTVNIRNVRSLKFNEKRKIEYFFSLFSLDSMINLRLLSLTQMYSLNDNTFLFWKQLASLKYLQFLKIKFSHKDERGNSSEEIEFLIHSIFNQNICPLLNTLIVCTNRANEYIRTMSSLTQTTQPANIKYFSIDELSFRDLIKLIPSLQNLRSINIDFEFGFDNMSIDQLEAMSIPIPFFPKCIQIHLYLTDHIYFEHIQYLLKHAPNLKDLCLSSDQYYLLNAKKWQSLITSRCMKLIKFQLRCRGYDDDTQYERISKHFENICRKKSFWIKRNTVVSSESFGDEDFYYITIQFNTKRKLIVLY